MWFASKVSFSICLDILKIFTSFTPLGVSPTFEDCEGLKTALFFVFLPLNNAPAFPTFMDQLRRRQLRFFQVSFFFLGPPSEPTSRSFGLLKVVQTFLPFLFLHPPLCPSFSRFFPWPKTAASLLTTYFSTVTFQCGPTPHFPGFFPKRGLSPLAPTLAGCFAFLTNPFFFLKVIFVRCLFSFVLASLSRALFDLPLLLPHPSSPAKAPSFLGLACLNFPLEMPHSP